MSDDKKKKKARKTARKSTRKDAPDKKTGRAKQEGQAAPEQPTSYPTQVGGVVDLDAFLLELSARLVTAGSVPLPAEPPAPVQPVERMQVIVFVLRGVRYAVEMSSVSEVMRGPVITRVPGLPAWVQGVTNLHGEIVSVVDLSRFLEVGALTSRPPTSMIVAQAADQRIGLMVDDVELIYTFPLEQVLSPPFKVEPSIVAHLRGAVEREKEFIRLLDCEQLLLGQRMSNFREHRQRVVARDDPQQL
jgi:purine-binding chemotaxis protein CheW